MRLPNNIFFIYRIGRKPTAIICSIGGCVGVIKVFLENYYAYLIVEFIESLMASGLYTVAVVLCRFIVFTCLCVFFIINLIMCGMFA